MRRWSLECSTLWGLPVLAIALIRDIEIAWKPSGHCQKSLTSTGVFNQPWKVSIDCSIETLGVDDVHYLNKMLCLCGCSRKHMIIGQSVIHDTSWVQSRSVVTQQSVALTSANKPINEKSLCHLIDASEAPKIESWNSHQSFFGWSTNYQSGKRPKTVSHMIENSTNDPTFTRIVKYGQSKVRTQQYANSFLVLPYGTNPCSNILVLVGTEVQSAREGTEKMYSR